MLKSWVWSCILVMLVLHRGLVSWFVLCQLVTIQSCLGRSISIENILYHKTKQTPHSFTHGSSRKTQQPAPCFYKARESPSMQSQSGFSFRSPHRPSSPLIITHWALCLSDTPTTAEVWNPLSCRQCGQPGSSGCCPQWGKSDQNRMLSAICLGSRSQRVLETGGPGYMEALRARLQGREEWSRCKQTNKKQ